MKSPANAQGFFCLLPVYSISWLIYFMQPTPQDRIIVALENKIAQLKTVLEHTIEKHSDTTYDLKDLKKALQELSGEDVDQSSEKMLVVASEWEDLK